MAYMKTFLLLLPIRFASASTFLLRVVPFSPRILQASPMASALVPMAALLTRHSRLVSEPLTG